MHGFGSHWYARDGTPISNMYELERLLRTPGYKILKQEHLWYGAWLSTVWLGLDHAFHFRLYQRALQEGEEEEPYQPLIFETMIFAPGTMHELECRRYPTEATALAGHAEMLREWRWWPWAPWRETIVTAWRDMWELVRELRERLHEWRHPDLTAAVQELGVETSFEKVMRSGRRLLRHSNIWVRWAQRIKWRGQRLRAAFPKVKAKDVAPKV